MFGRKGPSRRWCHISQRYRPQYLYWIKVPRERDKARILCGVWQTMRAYSVACGKQCAHTLWRVADNARILCGMWQTMRAYSVTCGKQRAHTLRRAAQMRSCFVECDNVLMFCGVSQICAYILWLMAKMRSYFVANGKNALIFCGVSQKCAHVRANNIYFLTLTTCARNM